MRAEPLSGALIGTERVSPFDLQAWGRIFQAAIVATADPDLERARNRAQQFGAAPLTEARAMIEACRCANVVRAIKQKGESQYGNV